MSAVERLSRTVELHLEVMILEVEGCVKVVEEWSGRQRGRGVAGCAVGVFSTESDSKRRFGSVVALAIRTFVVTSVMLSRRDDHLNLPLPMQHRSESSCAYGLLHNCHDLWTLDRQTYSWWIERYQTAEAIIPGGVETVVVMH